MFIQHFKVYNQTIDEVNQLEVARAAFVIRPSYSIRTKGMERGL